MVAVFAGNDFGDLLRGKIYALDEAGRLRPRSPRLGEGLRREFADAEQQAQGSMLLSGLRGLLVGPPHEPTPESLPG